MISEELNSKSMAKTSDTVRLEGEMASARTRLAKEFAALHTYLTILKWMMVLVAVGVWSQIMKSLFE